MPKELAFSIPVESLLKHTQSDTLSDGFIDRLTLGQLNKADLFILFSLTQEYVDSVTLSPNHKGKFVTKLRHPHPGVEKIKVYLNENGV